MSLASNMKKSIIHQTPAEKLANTSASTVSAVQENTRAVTKAIKDIPDHSTVVASIESTTKKLDEVKSASLIANRNLKGIEEQSKTANDLLKKMSESHGSTLQKMSESYGTIVSIDAKDAEIVSVRGSRGEKGEKGDSPTNKELVALITPLIPEPKNGKSPVLGEDYTVPSLEEILARIPTPKDGEDGKDGVGIDGIDGKDGSPDTPEQVVEKVNVAETQIDPAKVKGLARALQNLEGVAKEVRSYGSNPQGQSVGGNNPLKIQGAGTDLGAYITALNFSTNLTATYSGDGLVTVTGLAGGSGITRSVSSVAINTNAGSTALTDYVYFTTATLTLTLPTAVGNTNRYTVKCVSGTLTIDGAGAETIDGTATISVQVEDSVDLISNGTEFKVV